MKEKQNVGNILWGWPHKEQNWLYNCVPRETELWGMGTSLDELSTDLTLS